MAELNFNLLIAMVVMVSSALIITHLWFLGFNIIYVRNIKKYSSNTAKAIRNGINLNDTFMVKYYKADELYYCDISDYGKFMSFFENLHHHDVKIVELERGSSVTKSDKKARQILYNGRLIYVFFFNNKDLDINNILAMYAMQEDLMNKRYFFAKNMVKKYRMLSQSYSDEKKYYEDVVKLIGYIPTKRLGERIESRASKNK